MYSNLPVLPILMFSTVPYTVWHSHQIDTDQWWSKVHLVVSTLICVAHCHRQVFVAGSTKPHFFSSVLFLATLARRRLRHRHIVHPEFDPGSSFSSGVMFKRVLCGSALSFCFHACSLRVEIFFFRGSAV